jgi:hypothetical protein
MRPKCTEKAEGKQIIHCHQSVVRKKFKNLSFIKQFQSIKISDSSRDEEEVDY